ncbi:MAG: glycosyltransferase family 2 protein [Nitrospirota bacterium]|nr:glycosyltransferase family 2 protein [Nitrospirota bacterium]
MVYISIVVPIRNEEKFIGQTLTALLSQDYPASRYELIVVDGRSTDGTRSVVEQFMKNHPDKKISLLDNPGILSSSARNIGARAAQGKLIAIIDGHVHIPGNQLLKDMERLKEETGALCLARPAPLDVPEIKNGTPFWIAMARKSRLGHSRSSFIYSDYEGFVDPVSSGFAYDRTVFEKVGYFDETFDAAEDVEFHFRVKKAGIEAYTSPRFLIYSYPRESLSALFRQQVRYGEGRARFIRKHPEGFSKETLIPVGIFLYVAALPAALGITLVSPFLTAAYLAGLFVYLGMLMIAGLEMAFKNKAVVPAFIVAAALCTVHLGLGWGFLKTRACGSGRRNR